MSISGQIIPDIFLEYVGVTVNDEQLLIELSLLNRLLIILNERFIFKGRSG